MTQAELNALVNGLIIDNNTNQVTPAKVRSVFLAVIDSIQQTNLAGVTANAPLNYDAFNNLFTIFQSDSSTNGYLSSEDWNTFNDKQDLLTEVNFGALNNSFTTNDSLADGDLFSFTDVSDSNKQKKTTWSNIKDKLKTYFDGYYGNDLYRYWYSYTANILNTTLLQVNTTNALTVSGTASVVSRAGTLFYNSLAMNNYASATPNGSNAGIKNNNIADGSHIEGFDVYFSFANNDTNSGCETTVGLYSLFSAIPNIDKSSYTGDFIGVGNDVGDTNLSFYCRRVSPVAAYTKVDCGVGFPAHSTTDAYLFRMQASRGLIQNDRTLKMTITNIVTGAVFEHTFTGLNTPEPTRNICIVVNRSNRNTGVATNIRFSKCHITKFLY